MATLSGWLAAQDRHFEWLRRQPPPRFDFEADIEERWARQRAEEAERGVDAEVALWLEERLDWFEAGLTQYYHVQNRDGRMVLVPKSKHQHFDGFIERRSEVPYWYAQAATDVAGEPPVYYPELGLGPAGSVIARDFHVTWPS